MIYNTTRELAHGSGNYHPKSHDCGNQDQVDTPRNLTPDWSLTIPWARSDTRAWFRHGARSGTFLSRGTPSRSLQNFVTSCGRSHSLSCRRRPDRHQSPCGCLITTRVGLRIMKRLTGFSSIATLNAARAKASVRQTARVSPYTRLSGLGG
jgi:hypothetical protein